MIANLFKIEPYALPKEEKNCMMSAILHELTLYHQQHCQGYSRILDTLDDQPTRLQTLEELPFLPVRLFKEIDLYSVGKEQIVKTMTSSGTSGQTVSKIYLDNETSRNQIRALTQIVASFIGKKRLPMIILDTALIKKDRAMFSARGAGIVGFSMFGRDIFYALDEEMRLDLEGLRAFIQKYADTPIVLFGYTYMIWQYVLQALENADVSLHIHQGTLFHVGGWKRLQAECVDAAAYNTCAAKVLGNVRVHNYYGMAEQLGSVFVECEYGRKHCSIFSDILIRRAADFSCAEMGERGLIEMVSVLPKSYPGHILLTEDEGEIIGEDDCPCGRLGKTFQIHGRVQQAEVRGCSDTYGR